MNRALFQGVINGNTKQSCSGEVTPPRSRTDVRQVSFQNRERAFTYTAGSGKYHQKIEKELSLIQQCPNTSLHLFQPIRYGTKTGTPSALNIIVFTALHRAASRKISIHLKVFLSSCFDLRGTPQGVGQINGIPILSAAETVFSINICRGKRDYQIEQLYSKKTS